MTTTSAWVRTPGELEPSAPAELDPEVAAMIAGLGGSLIPPAALLPSARLRATINAAILGHDVIGFIPEEIDRVGATVLGGVPARVYTPDGSPTALIAYVHGGGFVAGNSDTHDKVNRRLAVGTGSIVASIEYRLAPEFPFPAPFDDCVSAIEAAVERFPGLPLVIAGDSAGGALTAAVAQWATDTGRLQVALQVLIYPCITLDPGSRSMLERASDYLLTSADLAYYRRAYLGGLSADTPYALPGMRHDLTGLPPAILTVAAYDPLYSEGREYAERLASASVPVRLLEHPTLVHGWLEIAEVVPSAHRARDELVEAINDFLSALHTAHSN